MGCHFLLYGIFPIQGLNPHLLSPALESRFFTTSTTWEALSSLTSLLHLKQTLHRFPQTMLVNTTFFFLNWRLITLQYCGGFCHTFTWISHGCTCVPHPEPHSHLPLHPIPQGHPSAPALSTLYHALNLDWRSVSHMIIYMFQCYSLRSSHPCLLPQSPKDCSLYLCLFCCLAYRVIITIFLKQWNNMQSQIIQ